MKKLFAVLSVLALTFAIVGLTKVSASEKFTVDPTITENDIPVYIMGSIKTTFPDYYDNDAEADPNWLGAARQYPWNETRLTVKQVGDDGKFTGKNYQVYFAGGFSAGTSAAGMGTLVLYADDNATGVAMGRYDGGVYGAKTVEYKGKTLTIRENYGPGDGSLSHATINISGKDLTINLLEMASVTGGESTVTGWAQQVYNRAMVFDASGRAIWGNATDGGYESAETPNETALPAEYCYINGVATRFTDAAACDKAQVAVLDADGQAVLDPDTGEAKMTEGTEPDYVTGRYVWQWVSNEQWEAHYKDVTNTVDYLAAGWDPEKWDDEFECDGGHMLIAFVNAAQSKFAINDEQAAAANAALVGTADEGKYSAGYVRKYVAEIYIPADAVIYDFGYLDRYSYNPDAETYFSEMMVQGYKYGRLLDENGEGMGKMTTYNFSAKPIYQSDVVVDGVSYQYLEGTQTIEVLKGAAFQPADSVTYTGLGKYWAIENDVFSYSSDTSKLRLTLAVDGDTKVQYVEGYSTFDEMVDAYVADVNAWLASIDGFSGVTHVDRPTTADITGYLTSDWYTIRWGGILGVGGTTAKFMWSDYGTKWTWMLDYINKCDQEFGSGELSLGSHGEIGWDGGISTLTLLSFLCQESPITSGYPRSVVVWDKENTTNWMDKETLADKFANYTIDTADAAVDTVYNVTFGCENPDTGNTSSYAIKYVVVDEYTPIIEVAKAANLRFTPVVADNGSMTFKAADGTISETIDPTNFATAYNAKYNGITIKGDDISSRIHYTSDTLDFDAPTEGNHKVTAKVYNGAKYAEKTFTVQIEDITAPNAAVVEKATVQYGSLFNPYDLIQYAIDNVDGNLFDVKGAISVSSAVNTTKAKDYTVTFTFSDEAGNYVEKTSKVTVEADPNEKVAELEEKIDALTTKNNELNDEIAAVKAQAETIANQTAGCGASSGAIMAGFFAMASLLVVVLKKRH